MSFLYLSTERQPVKDIFMI